MDYDLCQLLKIYINALREAALVALIDTGGTVRHKKNSRT